MISDWPRDLPITCWCLPRAGWWRRARRRRRCRKQVMADVFRISAYRAEYQREAVIVPWADI